MKIAANLAALIPVFNTKPAHLIESVDSILEQTTKAVVIVIVDDGSTSSDTIETLKFLQNRNVDVKVVTLEKNGGTSGALNAGHKWIEENVPGVEFIALQGSQDVSSPLRFAKQLHSLDSDKTVDVLGANLFSFWEDDIKRVPIFTSRHPWDAKSSPYLTKNKWYTNHGTVIYRHSAVMSVGGYNEKVGRGQDVELWGRMIAAKKSIKTLPEVLYAWRKHRKTT